MKNLFVLHTTAFYGATKSLQLLLKNCNEKFDIVIPRKWKSKNDIGFLKSSFGKNLENIYEFYLPFDLNYDGSSKKIKHKILEKFRYIMWIKNRGKFYKLIKKEKYRFIHLNELVLHQLINEEHNFFIHIRVILNKKILSTMKNLDKAKGLIFIDSTTKEGVKKRFENSIVLNNPFDMSLVKNYIEKKEYLRKYNLDGKVVFSIIGNIDKIKGVDIVIKSFLGVKNNNTVLLVVGEGTGEYKKYCMEIAKNDPRIIFIGEEKDVFKVYAASDYIVRGDPYFCIGRTIFEGLYSGCGVIIPGKNEDINKSIDLQKHKENVMFYEPSNIEKLKKEFEIATLNKKIKENFYSNVNHYIFSFEEFVKKILNGSKGA